MNDKRKQRASGEGWALVRECPACGKDERACACKKAKPERAGKPVARLRMEKRRGKPVTVLALEGFSEKETETLAREFKTTLGTGGTAKGNEVELQGEHREKVRGLLVQRGVRVKG
jgi:translation initiation factor 1